MPFIVEVPSQENSVTNHLSSEVSLIFEDFKYKMGLPEVPNILKVMSHSENVTKGSWALLENILINGSTPRSVKELLIMAISTSRNCNHYDATSSPINRMLGLDEQFIQLISSDTDQIHPLIIRDIINFGIKCAKDPRSLTSDDFKSLEQHNFSQAEIIEIISVVGLAVYFNIFVDTTGIATDKVFS